MAKLVKQNHAALHSIAEEITEEEFRNGFVAKLIKNMHEALLSYKVDGFTAVAIAAPQVGVAKRMFLVEDQSTERDPLPKLVAINPVILKASKKTHVIGEGCLSVPENYGEVRRHTNVTFKAQDEHGNWYQRGAGNLLAQVIQHEVDHLDGILFVDRAEQVWTKEEMKQREKESAKVQEK